MDFFNRALEQAKQLQQIAADAAQKGYEQATPLIRQGVAKAQELQKTIVEQTPHLTAAAQEQTNAALQHTNAFIASSKTVLEAGATQAQAHLSVFADPAKKAKVTASRILREWLNACRATATAETASARIRARKGQLLPSAPKMIQGRNPTMSRSMDADLFSPLRLL